MGKLIIVSNIFLLAVAVKFILQPTSEIRIFLLLFTIVIISLFRKKLRMSESVNDMVAYAKISDSIFEMIAASEDPNLKDVSRSFTYI